MADLLIRETILGILKSRDINGSYSIHASEFRKAITDLGIPWGSPVVENILVLCKNNGDGNIDFSNLEHELSRERRARNIQNQRDKVLHSNHQTMTSKGAPTAPWNPDVAHKIKISVEKQSKLLKDYTQELLEIYKRLSNKEISADQVMISVQKYGIKPTRSFINVISHAELSFKEFMRSLANYDDSIDNAEKNVLSRQAGVSIQDRQPKDVFQEDEGLFLERKRNVWHRGSKITLQDNPDSANLAKMLGMSLNTGFSTVNNYDGTSVVTMSDPKVLSDERAARKDTKAFKDTLFFDSQAAPALLSHAQEQMMVGAGASSRNGQEGGVGKGLISYNCNHKMLREQILAALRKLDSTEISVADFQERMYLLGLNIPDAVLLELRRINQCGSLDYKKCVQLLDNTLFKVTALYDTVPIEEIDRLKNILKSTILRSSDTSITKLHTLFCKIDEDNSNTLSFNEFVNACRVAGISTGVLSDKDLKLLFSNFDLNGDGELQFDEFMTALRGQLNPSRLNAVTQAFQKLDRDGLGRLNLYLLLQSFDASRHYDTVNGIRSPRDVTQEITDFFISRSPKTSNVSDFGGKVVSLQDFINYYSNLSVSIRDDEQFIKSVKLSWGVSESKAPPPADILNPSYFGNCSNIQEDGSGVAPKHVIYRNKIASTVISHGDLVAWTQEPTKLESANLVKSKLKREVHTYASKPQFYKWNSESNNGSLADKVSSDLKADGLNSVAALGNVKNMSSVSNLIQYQLNKSNAAQKNEVIDISPDDHEGRPPPGYVDYEPASAAGGKVFDPREKIFVNEFHERKKNTISANKHFFSVKPYGVEDPSNKKAIQNLYQRNDAILFPENSAIAGAGTGYESNNGGMKNPVFDSRDFSKVSQPKSLAQFVTTSSSTSSNNDMMNSGNGKESFSRNSSYGSERGDGSFHAGVQSIGGSRKNTSQSLADLMKQ